MAATRARGVEALVRVVFEEDGTPAANVGVYLRSVDEDALGVELRTDQTGLARFDDVERGGYKIDLDRWDREPVGVDLSHGLTIELAIPDGVDVEGVVLDTEGNPVPGADIYRLNIGHHDYLQWTATADAAGLFQLRDVALRTTLVARAEGFQPSSPGGKGERPRIRGAEVGGATEIRLVVGARGHRVFGRIVDELGNPAPHAMLALAVEEDTRSDGSSRLDRDPERGKPADLEAFSIRADENGFFSSREVPEGSVTYFARSADEEAAVAVGALEVFPGEEHELEIVLGPGAGVVGVLIDEHGQPVSNYVVEHEWRGSAELGQLEYEFGMLLANRKAVTAEDGSFQLLGLLPGETGLEVHHPAGRMMERELIELELGELFRWTPQIERLTDLTVRVVGPAGEPLAGWGVGLCGWPSSLRYSHRDPSSGFVPNATDAVGRYRYENVRPDDWFVTVHPPTPEGSYEVPPPAAIREGVYPGGEEVVVQVGVLPIASVRGRVLDAAGKVPVRSRRREEEPAQVHVRLGDFDECGGQLLDEDGGFTLEQLPAGTYTIVLSADGYPRDCELTTFDLDPGQHLDLGLLALPDPAYLEIEALVDDGEPADLRMHLSRPGEEWMESWARNQIRRDRDDPSGLFRSDPLMPGEYFLHTYADDTGVSPLRERIEIAPGETLRRTITLPRGRAQTIEVTLPPHPNQQPRKSPWKGPRVELDVRLFDVDGEFLQYKRDAFELFDVSGNRARVTMQLAPGTYRARLEDHRDPALRRPRPLAEIEFEVPADRDPDVLLVELR